MSMVHNVILRGINAIYNQALGVSARGTAKDKMDFAQFGQRWGEMVGQHHDSEEQMLFPEINEMTKSPGLMDANVNEHQLFHTGLDEFMGYLKTVTDGEVEFDGEKLRAIVDTFMPQLRDHLENEIDTLVELSKWDKEVDWVAWMNGNTQKIVMKNMKSPVFRVSQACFTNGCTVILTRDAYSMISSR